MRRREASTLQHSSHQAEMHTDTLGRAIGKGLLLLGGCGLCAFGALCVFIDWYGHQDHARPAAAIVILGAQMRANHQPGDSMRSRTRHAVALYQRHIAGVIICTGGTGVNTPAAGQAEAALARQLGVPEHDLLVEATSRDTRENARNAALICRGHGWSCVVAVSDPYHLWRVKRDFAAVGITAWTSPTPDSRIEAHWPLRLAWTIRDALAISRDVLLRK